MRMNCHDRGSLSNIIIMGFGFLFVFSAYQTSSMFVTIVLSSARNHTLSGSGYVSLSIINITMAFANWLAPFIIIFLSEKYSMFVGSLIYTIYFVLFLYPISWLIYVGSFCVGISAAMIWVAQGNFLSLNSVSSNIERNTTIFWFLYQSSLVFGNIFQFVMFRNSNSITDTQRIIFYAVFTVISGLGTFLLLFLRNPEYIYLNINESILEDGKDKLKYSDTFSPKDAFFQSFNLLKRKSFLALLIVFAYTGFEINFYSGVFGTAIGQTQQLGIQSIGYVGLIGIMIGVGELTCSILLSIISRYCKGVSSELMILIGLFAHIISFYLIFLSLPFDSPQQPSSGKTYIVPRIEILSFCGYLLGFGDCVYNIQIISLLADAYKGIDCPASFAMFNFVQTLVTGIAFYYCTVLTLQWQLLIISTCGILGTIFYIAVQRDIRIKTHYI